jgi:hypothetical protein
MARYAQRGWPGPPVRAGEKSQSSQNDALGFRENGMHTVSVQTVTTVASLGLCVRHAKTPDLYMSQEMCAGAGKLTWVKIGCPGLPGGNQ